MKYAQLLAISVKHSYYTDGLCPDFTLIPSAGTAKLFFNHGCVARHGASGLNVYVPIADESRPLIPFSSSSTLSFRLQTDNFDFPLYTDVKASAMGDGVEFQYSDRTVGIGSATLRIQRDFNQLGQIGHNVELAFSARSLPWLYYLVADDGLNKQTFSIIWGNPDLSVAWKLSAPSASDELGSYFSNRYPATTILRFVSDRNIPCRQMGWDKVSFAVDGNKVFESLPNPSYRQYRRFDLDEGRKDIDALFRVVTYTKNATLTKG